MRVLALTSCELARSPFVLLLALIFLPLMPNAPMAERLTPVYLSCVGSDETDAEVLEKICFFVADEISELAPEREVIRNIPSAENRIAGALFGTVEMFRTEPDIMSGRLYWEIEGNDEPRPDTPIRNMSIMDAFFDDEAYESFARNLVRKSEVEF